LNGKQIFNVYVHTMNIYFLLFTIYNNNSNINTKTLNHITNAPACFGASVPSSGCFDVAFAEVIKY